MLFTQSGRGASRATGAFGRFSMTLAILLLSIRAMAVAADDDYQKLIVSGSAHLKSGDFDGAIAEFMPSILIRKMRKPISSVD